MQPLFHALLVFTIFCSSVVSTALCPSACESALSHIVFSGNATKQQCTNQLHITSYYSCLRQYCPSSAQAEYASLQKTCKSTGALPTIANVTVNLNGLAKVTFNDLNKKAAVKNAVALDPSLYKLSVRTITSATEQDDINIRYGHAMYGFWAIALLISSLANLWSFASSKSTSIEKGAVHRRTWMGAVRTKLRAFITVPALAGRRTAENIGWSTVPPRLQSLTIAAFLAINIAMCVSGYDVFQGNLKRPTISNQVTRLVGRRTGIMIMANLPLMWTFAMRNNVLSWCSGWSFATFNSFHRWIARIVMAELVTHAIAYSLSEYYSGGMIKYTAQWLQDYWRWGMVSIIAGCLALTCAIYPIRQHFYDAFLLIHIVLATLFLVGTWFHIKKQDNEFDMYFWPCVAVWAFDRVLRLGRLILWNRSIGRADIIYDPSADVLRLDVPTKSIIRPHAGTYYYVYALHGLKFWESHPFTLSSWERTPKDNEHKTILKFLIRPLDGFTGRLRDLANRKLDSEGGVKTLQKRSAWVLVEGPYGHSSSMDRYASALFIVGGSGVTVALSHLHNLSAILEEGHEIMTRKVRLLWVVRYAELATSVLRTEILPWLSENRVGSKIEITIDIYVTSKAVESTPSPVDNEKDMTPSTPDRGSQSSKDWEAGNFPTDIKNYAEGTLQEQTAVTVQFHEGRPSLRHIYENYANQAAANNERVSIACCGPPAMADDVRELVVETLRAGNGNVDFFPESFAW